jgi:hypothetical protein
VLRNVNAIGISKVQPIRKRRERLEPRVILLTTKIVSTHRRLVNYVQCSRAPLAANAMLLNEFLKEHKKVEDLEGIVTSLAATVKEQAAQIQKVSAQLEASKPALQTVLNNQ